MTRLDILRAAPRPILKLLAAGLLVPATLDADFHLAKYDALLFFIAALYGMRAAEKVTDTVTKSKADAQ